MKMMKRLLLAMLVLAACCMLASCQKEAPEATPVATDVPAVQTLAAADDVLATIGNKTVTRAAFEGYLQTLLSYYANNGYDVTDPTLAALLNQYALQTAVEYAVMDQKLVELNLGLTEAERTAALEAAKAEWDAVVADGLEYYGVTEETTEEERATLLVNVLAELETMGYTEESYTADALMYAGYDKIFMHVTQGVEVPDEKVVEHYNALVAEDKITYEHNAAAYEEATYMNQLYAAYGMTDYVTEIYYMPVGYRLVTHILLEADEELLVAYTELQAAYEEQQNTLEEGGEVAETLITAEEVENARLAILAFVQPKVDEIKQKMAEGVTFAELIPQYTIDPGMSDEASIAAGYEVHMDSTNWVIPFRDAAFTVSNIGDVTAPVVTDYGVHILQYVADVPGGPVELTEDLHNTFKAELMQIAQNNAYYDALAKWVEEANVVYSAAGQEILAKAEAAMAAE